MKIDGKNFCRPARQSSLTKMHYKLQLFQFVLLTYNLNHLLSVTIYDLLQFERKNKNKNHQTI